jgi:hypothetical protein
MPELEGFWVVDTVVRNGEMAGVCYLALAGDDGLHLATGNVDSRDKQSVILQDYPAHTSPGRTLRKLRVNPALRRR